MIENLKFHFQIHLKIYDFFHLLTVKHRYTKQFDLM